MHLFVSVPTHSGTVAAETAMTLVAVQEIASRRGWKTSFGHVSGAVISEVRNVIAAQFLKAGADLLLMIDSDQSFDRATIERMIAQDRPLVGCIYPRRKYQWSNVSLEAATDMNDVLYQASDFVGRLEFDAEGSAQVVDGFARALHVGTGIFLVKRNVFEMLISTFPGLKNRGFHDAEYPGFGGFNFGFFNHLESEGECSLSEDISFCHRWRSIGGEIWADVSSNTTHVGRYAFTGNYLDYLTARGEISQQPVSGGTA